MPLKKIRKNATEATREKVIANNMGILFNHNKSQPAAQKKSVEEIRAAALNAAMPIKKRKSK